jgi:hypothetical protein
MQSEYAIRPADVGLLDISARATGGHPSLDSATKGGEAPDADERWRQWCVRGTTADRATARMMNGGFAALFVALSAWLVFQLLS